MIKYIVVRQDSYTGGVVAAFQIVEGGLDFGETCKLAKELTARTGKLHRVYQEVGYYTPPSGSTDWHDARDSN